MAEAGPRRVVRHMALDGAGFRRSLRPLLDRYRAETAGGDAWRLKLATGEVRLQIRPLPPRRLGSLTLPQLEVSLDLRRAPAAEAAEFLAAFERAFQRGGG